MRPLRFLALLAACPAAWADDKPVVAIGRAQVGSLYAEVKAGAIEVRVFPGTKVVRTIQPGGAVTRMEMSADERFLAAVVKGGRAIVWTLKDGKEHLRLPAKDGDHVWFGQDGELAVIGRSGMDLWWPETGQAVLEATTYGPDLIEGRSALVGPDGAIRLRTLDGRKPLRTIAAGGGVTSLALSDNGRYVAALLKEGRVVVWNAATGAEHLRLAGGGVGRLEFVRGKAHGRPGDDLLKLVGPNVLEVAVYSMAEKKVLQVPRRPRS